MSFLAYLKDKGLYIVFNIMLFIIFIFASRLINLEGDIIFIIFMIWFLPLIFYILLEYIKINKFYKEIESLTSELEEKYLITEVMDIPNFIEGKITYDILKECNRDMHEKVKFYREKRNEYKDYIDMWVHEIKTPIAASRLIIENDKNIVTRQIDREVEKIDKMVEQVLYYSKIDEANEDYRIRELIIHDIVQNVVKNNAMDFILKRIKVDIENVDFKIYSDKKWLEFILNQIISNALKYTNENGTIKLKGIQKENSVLLKVIDSGVGIPKEDLDKIFLKGYTGENGRKFGKSTGMGLYICKKLCDKLNIGLEIESEDIGTEVTLIFSRGKNTDLFK